MSDRIAAALTIAAEVHAGQVDKAGMPYILHPLHVLATVEWRDVANPYERDALICAAILHDAIEDAPADQRRAIDGQIYSECGDRCAQAVDALTRRPGESYLDDYIPRLARDWIARRVKLADLAHNMDASRLGDGAMPNGLLDRYRAAKAALLAADGDPHPEGVGCQWELGNDRCIFCGAAAEPDRSET